MVSSLKHALFVLLATVALAATPALAQEEGADTTAAEDAATPATTAEPTQETPDQAPAAEAENPWTLACELGATLISGNARSGAFSTGCGGERTFSKLKLSARADANWGRARFGGRGVDTAGVAIPRGDWITNQKNVSGQLRQDYLINDAETVYLFLIEGLSHDEFAGYKLRINLEAGAGYAYVKQDTQTHSVEAGIQYMHEQGIFSDDNRVGAVLAALGSATLSDSALFEYTLKYLPSFEDGDDWRLDGYGGLNLKINDRLSYKSGLSILYDNDPSLVTPLDPFGIESAGAAPIPARETDIQWTNVLVVSIF